ncbi:MAG: D-alanyl-D-alanine carboxypeptidase/D-alanyl-D-alanine-endopeptidase [Zoogloeaceae bacterium]|nr:D-alanyl-D-alanine carboxypeptidase/D-alanyl-D-alanine-endopeptidase [Zoogloeaceae bacterium]
MILGSHASAQSAQTASSLPPAVVRALATAKIPESAVAVTVQALDQNAPLLVHNAQTPMNPASVMKLVTTYAALEMLGPAATWQTSVWSEALPDAGGNLHGNLYVRGSGDPKLNLENFWILLRQLRARGVQRINGDLVLDRSRFTLPPYNPAAFDNRPLRAYNVGPDALLVDFYAMRFILRPEGNAIRFINESTNDNLQVVTQLTPGKGGCDGWRDRLNIRTQPGRLEISGKYPISCGEKVLLLSPLPPETHIEGLFRALWREMGGNLKGRVRTGKVPANATLLAQQSSPPVAEIVRDVNKWSNNVMARQLFLALSGEDGTPGAAAQRTGAWLRGMGLNFPELVLENGSGLSRRERISAEHLNRLLVVAWQSAIMPEFVASLPIAAVDGTMQKRLYGTPAAGRAHIKTGTLDGVKAAAGYVQDERGRRYAVTFLINHANSGRGERAVDELLVWVASGSR